MKIIQLIKELSFTVLLLLGATSHYGNHVHAHSHVTVRVRKAGRENSKNERKRRERVKVLSE